MALTNILVIQYNNYFNRTIKQPSNPENINSYYDPLTSYYDVAQNVNFYKGDGVNTELTFSTTKSGIDYLIEYNSEGTVLSRWFIIENMQTRSGQSKLTLRRDVIIDNIDDVLEAPIYVEKATINNIEDVAIYNQEEITFNQIKKSESILKDRTASAWIVGYYDNSARGENITVNPMIVNDLLTTVTTIESWDYFQYVANPFKKISDISLTLKVKGINRLNQYTNSGIFTLGQNIKVEGTTNNYAASYKYVRDFHPFADFAPVNEAFQNHDNDIKNQFYTLYPQYNHTEDIQRFNNRIIKVTTGTSDYPAGLYKINVTFIGKDSVTSNVSPSETFSTYVNNLMIVELGTSYTFNSSLSSNVSFTTQYSKYSISITSYSAGPQYSFTLSSNADELEDAPYSMFCIPYNRVNVGGATNTYTISGNDVLNLVRAIQLKLQSKLFDVQLLPYCPMRDAVDILPGTVKHFVNEDDDEDTSKNQWLKNGSNTITIIYFPKKSSFTFDLTFNRSVNNNVVDLKIANQCDLYRLCSPNYAASFDFNLVKTGNLTKINIDCTYKPYSPYIHLNPIWSKLYGSDFNDPRGLICQGDFSLPVINNQWQEYQINNKNYLNAFNRQIDSIELNNKYQKLSEGLNVATGAVSGAMSGAVIGGGVGAAAGAVLSVGAGIADMAINEKLRRDSLDLTKDQFNYNLQNIQARPNTLSKVSSFDMNNKIFPIIEYYSCTEQEKEIFKNKLKFNGMTIMRISYLANFISSTEQYFKGKVIRLDDIAEDYHMANSIADELNKGVFIKL